VISVQENGSAPTVTSSIWRRIRVGTAGSDDVEFPSNSRSYRWGRRRDRRLIAAPSAQSEVYQLMVSKIHVFLQKDASLFRR
jgi:hypothetical protein